jgi:hypothetical protein
VIDAASRLFQERGFHGPRPGFLPAVCGLLGGSVHWRLGSQMQVGLGRDRHLLAGPRERVEEALVARHGKSRGDLYLLDRLRSGSI